MTAVLAASIFDLTSVDVWTMLVAACSSVACGVIGCFLVLRRQALLGDAISHAILPGLALAFMLTGTRDPLPMFAGALGAGVLTAILSVGLHRWGRVHEDAAMGVVFATFFAVGVVLINLVARRVDLDPSCVLWGNLEFAGLDLMPLGPIEAPRALRTLGPVLALNVGVIVVFFKELRIASFDPHLATTMGISAAVVHYGLMTLVAGTCVASFEAVGSVLVVAMLVAPGATAHLLTDRLGRMIWIAAGVAVVAAVVGYMLAVHLRTTVAGMIGACAGAEFFAAVMLAPRRGVATKVIRRIELARRIDGEDILGMLYRWHEQGRGGRPLVRADILAALAGGWTTRWALWSLRRAGMIRTDRDGAVRLTPEGRDSAARVVRSHRLWESYLARHLGLPLDHLHEPSHRAEHFVTPAMREAIGREITPALDPHGRAIPPADA